MRQPARSGDKSLRDDITTKPDGSGDVPDLPLRLVFIKAEVVTTQRTWRCT
jgi:hypothetical protein